MHTWNISTILKVQPLSPYNSTGLNAECILPLKVQQTFLPLALTLTSRFSNATPIHKAINPAHSHTHADTHSCTLAKYFPPRPPKEGLAPCWEVIQRIEVTQYSKHT